MENVNTAVAVVNAVVKSAEQIAKEAAEKLALDTAKASPCNRQAETDIIRKGKDGLSRNVGKHYVLGVGNMASMRAELRDCGYTNPQANKLIREWTQGAGGNMAWAKGQVLLEQARSNGGTLTGFDQFNKGTFVLRGSAIPSARAAKVGSAKLPKLSIRITEAVEAAVTKAKMEQIAEVCRFLGTTPENYAAMVAERAGK